MLKLIVTHLFAQVLLAAPLPPDLNKRWDQTKVDDAELFLGGLSAVPDVNAFAVPAEIGLVTTDIVHKYGLRPFNVFNWNND